MSTNDRRTNTRLKTGPDHAPFPKVRRLFCIECGALRDAHRIGRAVEFTLEPCQHVRLLMSSEIIGGRNDATER
jgi:hypothetical protein